MGEVQLRTLPFLMVIHTQKSKKIPTLGDYCEV